MIIEIREVELKDVASLQQNCFSLNTVDQTRANVEAALAEAAASEGTSIVAVQDEQVLGNVSVTRNAHRLQRHRAHLGGFVIHPSAQKQGLARRLTDRLPRVGTPPSWARRGSRHLRSSVLLLGHR